MSVCVQVPSLKETCNPTEFQETESDVFSVMHLWEIFTQA
jgi:hypothetical protein